MIKYSNDNHEVISNGKIIVKKREGSVKAASESFMDFLDEAQDFTMNEDDRIKK